MTITSTHRTAPTEGRALTQRRAGSGPPLVALHGLGLNWRSWLPVLGALEEHHEVAVLDLPGFGAAAALDDGPPSPQGLAGAVERELDRLGWEAPVLVGNSVGGWAALELAVRGRASRVVAFAPSGLETPAERAYLIAANEMMRARGKLAAPLGSLVTRSWPGRVAVLGGLRSRPWRVLPDDGAQEVAAFARSPGFQPTLRWTVGTSIATGLAGIDVPVRIAFGTRDVLLGPTTAPRFAALIPGAELVALPGVGHVPMSDDPPLVARTILEFTGTANAR